MPTMMMMKEQRERCDVFFNESLRRRKRRTNTTRIKIARNSPLSFFALVAFFLCFGGSFLQTTFVEAVVEVETGVTSDGIFGWSASVGVLFDDFMCDVINPLLAPNERFSECGGTFAVNPNGIGYAEEGQFVPGTRTVETERRAETTKSGFVFEEVSLIEGEQVSTPVYTANNADDDSNTNDNDEVPPPAGDADVDPQSSNEKERAEEEEEKARIEADLKAKAEAELKAELKAELRAELKAELKAEAKAKAEAEAEAARVKAKEEEERFDDDDDQSYSSDQTFEEEEEEAPARGGKEQDEQPEKEDKVSSNENNEPLEIIWQAL